MAGDANFDKVSLLLHADGASGATAFADSSSYANTVTAFGGAQMTTAQVKFGSSAAIFNDTSAYLSAPPSTNFTFGTGDFCQEAFIYASANPTSDAILFCLRNANAGIFNNMVKLSPVGKIGWSDGVAWRESSGSIPLSQWVHVAVTRASGVVRIFINGVGNYSASHPIDLAGARVMQIGAFEAYGSNPVGGFFGGFLDEIRITKGLARYTANFTPPTEPFPNAPAAYALSGAVTDASKSPAARLIRAYREDTGALAGSATSNAVSGAYSIVVYTGGAHTLNAYPAAGESLPTLTLRGVLPA